MRGTATTAARFILSLFVALNLLAAARLHDAAGRQTTAVLHRGESDQAVRTWTYVPGQNDVASETVNGTTTAYQYDERGRVATVTTWSTPTVAHISASESWDAERVSLSTDDRGYRTFALTALDGLRSRTVRELSPGALESVAGMVCPVTKCQTL